MQFRLTSAKIQPKNLKQHFDWGTPASWALLGYALKHRWWKDECFRVKTIFSI